VLPRAAKYNVAGPRVAEPWSKLIVTTFALIKSNSPLIYPNRDFTVIKIQYFVPEARPVFVRSVVD
jgi:type 1 glutamine amidotransferase